jgi:integrase
MRIKKRTWTNRDGTPGRAYVVDLGIVPGTKKRRRRQFKTLKEARQWIQQRPAEELARAAAGTVLAAANAWIDQVKADGRARSTWRKYEEHRDKHIAPVPVGRHDGDEDPRPFGEWSLPDVKSPVVLRFKNTLQKRGLSADMVQRVMGSVRMMLRHADVAGMQPGTTGDTVRAKRGERHRRPIDIPTPAEVRALLRLINGRDEPTASFVTLGQALINLLAATGLRPEEARALPESHLQVEERPYFVDVAWAADERNVIGPPKSKAGYRRLPLSDDVARILRAWLKAKPKSNNAKVGPLVFPTSGGHVYGVSNLYHRVWRPLMRRAGLVIETGDVDSVTGDAPFRPKFTMYALRHFYASMLIAQGVRDKALQRKMGHASVQLTYDIYGHLWEDAESERAIAAGVGRFLAG